MCCVWRGRVCVQQQVARITRLQNVVSSEGFGLRQKLCKESPNDDSIGSYELRLKVVHCSSELMQAACVCVCVCLWPLQPWVIRLRASHKPGGQLCLQTACVSSVHPLDRRLHESDTLLCFLPLGWSSPPASALHHIIFSPELHVPLLSALAYFLRRLWNCRGHLRQWMLLWGRV